MGIRSGHAIEKLGISAGVMVMRWRSGCVYAAELSHLLGYIDQDLVVYHRSLLGSLGLPTSWNNGTWDDVLALMHRDKRLAAISFVSWCLRASAIRFILRIRLRTPLKRRSVVFSSKQR